MKLPKLFLNKNITFFYTDGCERQTLEPVAEEARQRGYLVSMTDRIYQDAEIGVYCYHASNPHPNARFSIIMLHDIAQGHLRWPFFWTAETWNVFDIGILPNQMWADMWHRSSANAAAWPRLGTYVCGWPKADILSAKKEYLLQQVQNLKNNLGLKHEKTVLYTPSWENHQKQVDFVELLKELPLNLVIKQAEWSPKLYPTIVAEIERLKQLHTGYAPNVYVGDPSINIMHYLQMADIVVSDESSILVEALLFDIPGISVSDWLIPDTNPPRYAHMPFDFILKVPRASLRDTVSDIAAHSERYRCNLRDIKKRLFPYIGSSSAMIMDIVDSFVKDTTSSIGPLCTSLAMDILKCLRRSDTETAWWLLQRWIDHIRHYAVVSSTMAAEPLISPAFIDHIPSKTALIDDRLEMICRSAGSTKEYTLPMFILRGIFHFQTGFHLEEFLLDSRSWLHDFFCRWLRTQGIEITPRLLCNFAIQERIVLEEQARIENYRVISPYQETILKMYERAVFREYAFTLHREHQHEQAISSLSEILKWNHGDFEAIKRLAESAMVKGRKKEAVGLLTALVKLVPTDIDCAGSLALIRMLGISNPVVSIIVIPSFEHDNSLSFFRELASNTFPGVYEIIVPPALTIDKKSSDFFKDIQCSVKVSGAAEHDISSLCMAGANCTRGQVLVFIRTNVCPMAGWLPRLFQALLSDDNNACAFPYFRSSSGEYLSDPLSKDPDEKMLSDFPCFMVHAKCFASSGGFASYQFDSAPFLSFCKKMEKQGFFNVRARTAYAIISSGSKN